MGSLLLYPEFWCAQDFVVPSKSLFPWGFLVLLPDPQVGKSAVGPRTFATVWELLCYNCSALYVLCALWLYGGTMAISSKKTYATCCISQVWCSQSPCPHSRSLLAHASTGDTQTLKGMSGSVSCRGSLLLALSPGVHSFVCALWASLVGLRFDFKHSCTPPTILLRLLLCPWMQGIFFFGGIQHSLVDGCLWDWKRSVFIPIPKKGNTKECSNYGTIALISHASKIMFKIQQARLQQNMNQELPDVQAGLRKGRRTREQIANICWIIEKARELEKNIYFCFIDYPKSLWLCGSQ